MIKRSALAPLRSVMYYLGVCHNGYLVYSDHVAFSASSVLRNCVLYL